MFYTLLKFLIWGLLMAFIGGCVGWGLRALKCRGEVARARATTVDHDEVDRMRHRLANLEHIVADRDRLRMQVADMRHADSPGVIGAPVTDSVTDEVGDDAVTDESSDDAPTSIVPDVDESDEAAAASQDVDDAATIAPLMGVPDDSESADDATDAEAAPSDDVTVDNEPAEAAVDAESATDTEESATEAQAAPETEADASAADDAGAADGDAADASALDLDAAAAAVGKKIKLDDLTVVEGIGPKIAELCAGVGITTWRGLADADVATLQSMLDDAGSRFSVHKPGTWPRQAGLLATGKWEEFVALTDELDGGR